MVALVFVLFLEPRPLGRLRRFFRLSAGAAVPAPVGVSLPASSCVSGATTSFVDSSTSCTAAATSSSVAPALPVGRATLLSARSRSCSGSAGRERFSTIGSLCGVSAGSFERCGARFRDEVLFSGCWVSCCRTRLRRFWLTNSVHLTVAFELSPAVCPPADGIQSSLRMRCPSVCISKRTVACSTSSSDHARHLSTSQISAGTRNFYT